jgi:glutamyl-Q tRNA(Asp) synthetase
MTEQPYRGRFAPSPTGPLHFGSLIAATASYLQARSQQGEWFVRIEDIDPPREMPGASEAIVKSLAAFGFEWDGAIDYQQHRIERFHAALETLKQQGMAYPCACTRKQLADYNSPVYPGICRHGLPAGSKARAWRIRTANKLILQDGIQGHIEYDLPIDAGDFVLLRADGLIAYQLAVAIDDAEQGITEVVRGADLLDSTPRQIYIQRVLQLASPHYAHHPVIVNRQGEKLSKQTHAPELDDTHPVNQIWQALAFLGQSPEEALKRATIREIWDWAYHHWKMENVPKIRTIQEN